MNIFNYFIQGGPPCPPFTYCWCLRHPNVSGCKDILTNVNIPISDYITELIFLTVSVTFMGYIIFFNTKKIKR